MVLRELLAGESGLAVLGVDLVGEWIPLFEGKSNAGTPGASRVAGI